MKPEIGAKAPVYQTGTGTEPRKRKLHSKKYEDEGEGTTHFRYLTGRNRKAAEQRNFGRAGQRGQIFLIPCMDLKERF